MPRPNRNLDQALLRSGRVLYARSGCSGLSLRALAEHAGVNPGMFHYHFRSKEAFLRVLLQQLYEEMFAQLRSEATQPGPPGIRLRQALLLVGRFVRANSAIIGRIWNDAGQGEAVAREFLQANVPRHLGLLLELLDETERAGEIAPMAAMQRFSFVVGSVLAPLLLAPRLIEVGLPPPPLDQRIESEVLSDAAIESRVEMALAALRRPAVRPARAGVRTREVSGNAKVASG